MKDRRKPILISESERATDAELQEVARRCRVRVFPKVRIADALDITSSGLSKEEYGYALRSHFDFLIAGVEDDRPLFALEFDGPHHDIDPETILRDQTKEAICTKLGLPLLRIDAGYLRRIGQYTIISWLIELWFYQRSFNEAQERGEIGYDESFCYFSLFDSKSREGFAIDSRARLDLFVAATKGICTTHIPTTFTSSFAHDAGEYVTAHAIAPLSVGRYIIGTARCRSFDFPAGIEAWELATDLAVVDAAEKLGAYLRRELEPSTPVDLVELQRRTSGWIQQGAPLPKIEGQFDLG